MRPSLYLDEDVLPELARVLRASGYDVVSAHESGVIGVSDRRQLETATRQGRALLSFNYRHFLQLGREWFDAGREHAGIIVSFRQYRRDEMGTLRRAVIAMLDALTAEELRNGVYVLDRRRGTESKP